MVFGLARKRVKPASKSEEHQGYIRAIYTMVIVLFMGGLRLFLGAKQAATVVALIFAAVLLLRRPSPTQQAVARVAHAFRVKIAGGKTPTIDANFLDLLCARVCHGAGESAFDTLQMQGIKVKPFCWILGADGIAMLLDDGDVANRLRMLGFTDKWMAKKLADGNTFRLALMPASSAVPATWDGVLDTIRQHFTPALSAKCDAHAAALRSTPFAEIQARATAGYLRGATYFDVNEAAGALGGRSKDARFMSAKRLASESTEGTLEQVRGFLYHVLGMSELFDGAGVTKTADGERAVREYLMKNRAVKEFGAEFAWVELPLSAEALAPDK